MASFLYQAYIDESGTHEGAEILTVAGYYGTSAQWQTFLDNWKQTEFHAKERRFDALKPQLAHAIDLAQLGGVEVCLRPWEFKNHANSDFKNHIGNAYAVCAFSCATRICELIGTDTEARVAFVLEDGQPNANWVQRILIAMMQRFPIASVTIAKKRDFPQLHTADFLAYFKKYHRRAVDGPAFCEKTCLGATTGT